MDPDAINGAAALGTSRSGEPARTPARQVGDFLKTEAFYLAVVILVIVMGGMKTWKELHVHENTGPNLLFQKDLDANAKDFLTLALTHPEGRTRRAAAFATGIELLSRYLLFAGVAMALVMGISRALRGRRVALPAVTEPPWGLWDVFKLAALWAAGAQILHMKLFFPLNPERPFAVPGDWMAEIFIAILLVGTTIHIVVAERGGHLRDLGIRGRFFGGIGVGLTAFLVVQPFLWLVAYLEECAARSGWIPKIPVQQILQVILETRSGWVLALAAMVAVVVAPISEELLFRGFLQPALGRWTGRWLAIVLGAAFFAVAHMDLYAMPALLVLGIALGYVYDRTRSLAAPVALHMAFNGITLLSVFAFRGLMTALSAPH
jgi:membrane protease YdiL (CAAX protease family)